MIVFLFPIKDYDLSISCLTCCCSERARFVLTIAYYIVCWHQLPQKKSALIEEQAITTWLFVTHHMKKNKLHMLNQFNCVRIRNIASAFVLVAVLPQTLFATRLKTTAQKKCNKKNNFCFMSVVNKVIKNALLMSMRQTFLSLRSGMCFVHSLLSAC